MPVGCSSMRSIARCVLPVLVGPSSAVITTLYLALSCARLARMQKDRHCSHSGGAFATGSAYPRTCESCKNVTYKNPIPVAVLLLPVDDGLLGIKRGIEPKEGMLALPGGFVDHAETWQEGAARELFEETNIVVDPNLIT